MRRFGLLSILLPTSVCLAASNASGATNQFRGVNWADQRDNFQTGIIYVSGISSSDTNSSAAAVADRVVGQLMSKLGSNSVRLPINEATVSQYWSTYTGAIDMALSKGNVILCFWSSASGSKPADINAFWTMWTTVVGKYGDNPNAYFEVFNEPSGYSKTDLGTLYETWLTKFPTVPKGRVILDGSGLAQNVPDIGSDIRFDGCLLAVHDYTFFVSTSWTAESQWSNQFEGEVGTYADRTVCTEWGAPMSPGSKSGVSYDAQDYDSPPGSYFVAYVRGVSTELRALNMGSFYWPGLRDGDWYSMTTKTGSGSSVTLTLSNQSGLDRLQYAWGGIGPLDAGIPSDAGASDDSAVAGHDAGSEGGNAQPLGDGSAADAAAAIDAASSSSGTPSSSASSGAASSGSGSSGGSISSGGIGSSGVASSSGATPSSGGGSSGAGASPGSSGMGVISSGSGGSSSAGSPGSADGWGLAAGAAGSGSSSGCSISSRLDSRNSMVLALVGLIFGVLRISHPGKRRFRS